LKEHLLTTPFRYKVVMRLNGVKQELVQGSLIITLDNKRIDDMQLYFPDEMDKYLEAEKLKLSKEISTKMKVIENIDYNIGVI